MIEPIPTRQRPGAEPGPVAYGRGGSEARATDANLVLGRIERLRFLGGQMQLDTKGVHESVVKLAEDLQMDVLETAEGIIAILNAKMANASRVRKVQKGTDPRDYSLLAAGGADPPARCRSCAPARH